jgi:hypothetical protein
MHGPGKHAGGASACAALRRSRSSALRHDDLLAIRDRSLEALPMGSSVKLRVAGSNPVVRFTEAPLVGAFCI